MPWRVQRWPAHWTLDSRQVLKKNKSPLLAQRTREKWDTRVVGDGPLGFAFATRTKTSVATRAVITFLEVE